MADAAPCVDTDDVDKWLNLLPDLLRLVAFELDDHKDLLTFRSVCKSWRSVAMADACLTPFPPLLLVPYSGPKLHCWWDDDEAYLVDDPLAVTVLGPSSRKEFTVQLPETVGKSVKATAHGYLILVSCLDDGNEFSDALVSLFNPITGLQIHLPVLHSRVGIRSWLFNFRALLSSHPHSEPPAVLAIWAQRELFFLTLGDDHWTSYELGEDDSGYYSPNENGVFAYCHNSFFLSSQYTPTEDTLKVINAQSLESSELDVPYEKLMYRGYYHMILYSGDLFLVVSNTGKPEPYKYKSYATFKLVKESIGQWEWSKEDIYNDESVTTGSTLFLSTNLSIAVASPGLIRCADSYIYHAFGLEMDRDHILFRPNMLKFVVCTAEFDLLFIKGYFDPSGLYIKDTALVEDCIWICDEYHHYSESSLCTWFVPNIS